MSTIQNSIAEWQFVAISSDCAAIPRMWDECAACCRSNGLQEYKNKLAFVLDWLRRVSSTANPACSSHEFLEETDICFVTGYQPLSPSLFRMAHPSASHSKNTETPRAFSHGPCAPPLLRPPALSPDLPKKSPFKNLEYPRPILLAGAPAIHLLDVA